MTKRRRKVWTWRTNVCPKCKSIHIMRYFDDLRDDIPPPYPCRESEHWIECLECKHLFVREIAPIPRTEAHASDDGVAMYYTVRGVDLGEDFMRRHNSLMSWNSEPMRLPNLDGTGHDTGEFPPGTLCIVSFSHGTHLHHNHITFAYHAKRPAWA